MIVYIFTEVLSDAVTILLMSIVRIYKLTVGLYVVQSLTLLEHYYTMCTCTMCVAAFCRNFTPNTHKHTKCVSFHNLCISITNPYVWKWLSYTRCKCMLTIANKTEPYTLLIYGMFLWFCLTFHSVNRNMGMAMPPT